MAKQKRGYSREFTPKLRTPESRRRLHVDWVPPTLYDKIAARAKREGVSVRTLVLRLLIANVPYSHSVRQREFKAAYLATQKAIRRGELVRPDTCPECGAALKGRRIGSHHPDHGEETAVEWMCDRCHNALSQKLVTWGDMPQGTRVRMRERLAAEGVSLRALTLRLWKQWLG